MYILFYYICGKNLERLKNMTIQVSSIHPARANAQIFTSSPKEENLTSVKREDAKREHNSNTLRNSLIALGAMGLGAILAFKRGKIDGVEQTLKRLKNIDVNDFKAVGKFEKGKATIDGNGFTGVIHTPNAKMTYKNGELLKSELSNGMVKTYTKTYDHRNGNLSQVFVDKPNNYTETLVKKGDGSIKIERKINSELVNDRGVWYETKVTPDKQVSKQKIEQYNIQDYKFKNGELQALRKTTDLKTGKSKIEYRSPKYGSRVKYKEHIMVDGKKVTAVFKDGKFQYANHTTFNPKTGVLTQQDFVMQDGKLVPTNKFRQIDKKTGVTLYYEAGSNGEKNIKELYNIQSDRDAWKFFGTLQYTKNLEQIKEVIQKLGLKFEV